MTETTERFLQEIATRVGHDRVAELYLFPVLRQGGVEGAVAVVAAYPEPAAGEVAGEPVTHDVALAAPADVDAADAEPMDADAAGHEAPADERGDESSRHADSADIEPGPSDQSDGTRGVRESWPRARHVVYTARYRHTVKGTDRGRWAVEVVAEADAPLITVEEVVRGVVRRSGDAFQPERISGEQFRAIVPAPAAP